MATKKTTKQVQRFATVTLPNGEKKRIAARGKNEREALQKLAKLKAEYDAGLIVVNSNTTFEKWFDEFMEVYKKNKIIKSSQELIRCIIVNYFIPYIGKMKIAEIKLIHLQNCINEMSGYSYSYVSKAAIYIKEIFQKAVENDLIIKSPAIGLQPPAAVAGKRRSLTPREIEVFKKAMAIHKHGALFGIMLACGLRPAEARALTWFNVNLRKKEIKITQAVEANSNNLKPPKTAAGVRIVPIPDWFIPYFPKPNGESPFVFQNSKGELISNSSYKKAWESFLRQMDILAGAKMYKKQITVHAVDQKLTPYYLRHTYATSLAEKGVELKTAQYLLGHTNISITAGIYTHVTEKMLETAKQKINAV